MNIEIDSRKNRVMLRRTPHEKIHPYCSMYRTKQGSGSIGIWACMNYEGICCFKLFDGRLDSQRYIGILDNYLMPSIDIFFEKTWELSSNKIILHVILLRFASNGLKKKTLKSCVGQSSPDQYCIENLWSWLDHNLVKIKMKDY